MPTAVRAREANSQQPLGFAPCARIVVDHPLVAHKLTALRDERHRLPDVPPAGRRAGHAAGLRGHPRRPRRAGRRSRTPVAPTTGRQARRARSRWWCRSCGPGSGMLDGMMRLLPTAEVGFLGMVRNEETLRGLDVRRAAARRPVRPAVLRARPDARHRRHAGGGDPVPHRPRRRPHHRDLPARGARGLRSGSRRSSTALDVPVTVVTAAHGREAQREGLHRPGPRRRRRPAYGAGRADAGCATVSRSGKIGTVPVAIRRPARPPRRPRTAYADLLADRGLARLGRLVAVPVGLEHRRRRRRS